MIAVAVGEPRGHTVHAHACDVMHTHNYASLYSSDRKYVFMGYRRLVALLFKQLNAKSKCSGGLGEIRWTMHFYAYRAHLSISHQATAALLLVYNGLPITPCSADAVQIRVASHDS